MKDEEKTKKQFINELLELRQRITELEKTKIKRKEVEKALQQSEERFRQVAESSGEFIWEVDVNGLYTYANPVVEEILGYKPDELIGKKHFYNFFHPDVMDTLKKAAFEVIAKKEVFRNFINPNVHKNGNTVILETSGLPIIDNKGTLLGYRGSDRNVTERKKAEDALRESEEKYRTVSDFTYDWEYWLAPDGHYIYVSPSCERITGYRAEEFLADHDLFKRIIHPDDRFLVKNHLRKILPINKDIYHVDFRIINRNGEERWISHSCQPVYSNDGRFLGRRGSNRDITNRKLIGNALKESEERYKKLVKAVTAYTYAVKVREGQAISTSHSTGCIPITGYYPEDYESDPYLWHTMIYPDDKMMVENAVKEIMAIHEILPIEHRIIRRDGTVVWVRNTIVPYYDLNGLLIRYDGLIEDITERKLAEEEIQKPQ
jgi:PAS domain S-box-containing protein